MPLTQATVDAARTAMARAFQDLQETFKELDQLYSGNIIRNADGSFSLDLTPAQKDTLKTRLANIAAELSDISTKITTAIS